MRKSQSPTSFPYRSQDADDGRFYTFNSAKMEHSEHSTDVITQPDNNSTRILAGIKDNILIVLGGIVGGVAADYEAVNMFGEFSKNHGTTSHDLLGVLAGALAGGVLQYYRKRNRST